jgi:hypothetical protein
VVGWQIGDARSVDEVMPVTPIVRCDDCRTSNSGRMPIPAHRFERDDARLCYMGGGLTFDE